MFAQNQSFATDYKILTYRKELSSNLTLRFIFAQKHDFQLTIALQHLKKSYQVIEKLYPYFHFQIILVNCVFKIDYQILIIHI